MTTTLTYHTLFRITTFSEQVRSLWLKKKDHWQDDMTRKDLKADLMYLRAGNRNRAIGVITNRTWNYWTASGHNCGSKPWPDNDSTPPNPVYQTNTAVLSGTGNNKLKVCGMKWKKYAIYYFNAQTLQLIDIQIEWGPKLNLEYPMLFGLEDTSLTDRPFVLFKAVLLNELQNGGDISPGLAPNNQGMLAGQSLRNDSLQKSIATKRDSNNSISQIRSVEKITLHPNPNNGNFTFQLPEKYELGEIHIKDVLGKEVYSEKLKNKRVELHLSLPNGMYHLHFVNENKVETLQFLVR